MKVAFAGTPEFAATVLRGLLASEHEVGLVISQPDRPRGRGRKARPTPVAALAAENGLYLIQPTRIGEAAGEISAHDALVVAAYGQILRADTLYAARHGAWNVHASLLPRHRGAAPVERAIMAGDTETGVSIMRMDEGLDTGPVALQRSTPIGPDTTGGELLDRLAQLGANALVEVLSMVEQNDLTLHDQDNSRAIYAPKLTDEERNLRWQDPAPSLHNTVRALSPHIGARAYHAEVDGPLRVLRSQPLPAVDSGADGTEPGEILPAKGRILVACGEGVLEILELQAPGKRPVSAAEYLRGNRLEGAFRV